MQPDSRQALISVDDLVSELAEGRPGVLVDVRWQLGGPSQQPAYLAGHIPGAHWCDLEVDLADPPGPGGRHPLPDPARLQVALRRWGIDDGSRVIVYDGASSVAAARAWWVLRWAGLSQVAVLDGGFAAWLAAEQPTASGPEPTQAGTVTVAAGALPTLDAATAETWAAAGRLVDVRAPERFAGELEPIDPVAGHIPGALNLPTTANLQPSGEFLPAAQLRERFAALATDEPVGLYCGSGVTAAHTALAMQVAGLDTVLYPGSWSEWITDPQRPVATGGALPPA